MKETRGFIERQLPVLVHLQVTEALHENTLGINNIRDFEKTRLNDLMNYARENEIAEANIGKLKAKLMQFCEVMLYQGKGVAPFIFGKGRDYWPMEDRPVDKKTNILINRYHLEDDHARTLLLVAESRAKDIASEHFRTFEQEILQGLGLAESQEA